MSEGWRSAVAISAPVREALDSGRPVVALESTILTHGLPRPKNLEVALDAERLLFDAGVIPATVGVVNGVPTVGLSSAEIERLASGRAVVKASVRDLPVAVGKGLDGGTTVAATARLAATAGIAVFATGGVGGVHHGASTSFDESADLVTLSQTPIVVVSAGVKSILDVAATLERLETLNVPVVGYRTHSFPGFYVANSGYSVEHSVDSATEVARIATSRDGLGLSGALLVANPVPVDQQLPPDVHDTIISEAWEAASEQDISGQEITPFLLDYIQRATHGQSLEVNVSLYRNNVRVAAEIATAIAG